MLVAIHIVLLQPHASEYLYVVCSMDSKCREESARLLGCLIRSCPRLILPYIAPIHKVSKIVRHKIISTVSCASLTSYFHVVFYQALVARLCEGTGPMANTVLAAGVLATVGELAKVVCLSLSCDVCFISPSTFTIVQTGPIVSNQDLPERVCGWAGGVGGRCSNWTIHRHLFCLKLA